MDKRVPKCRGCGSDALSCTGIRAHDKRIHKANLEALRRWRKKMIKRN
jgi:hypothetical protein